MRLLIIRHGKAQDTSPTGLDADRPLRPRGERQAAWLGERLKAEGFAPDLILASRMARARETARRLAAALGGELRTVPELESGRAVSEAIRLIGEHAGAGTLALVGHNPQLAGLASVLLAGPTAPAAELRTGEAVILTIDPASPPGSGTLDARLRLPKEGD